MNIEINQALKALREQVAPLDQEAKSIEERLAAINTVRDQFHNAIAALERPPLGTDKAKSRKVRCIRKRDCVGLTESLLSDNGGTMAQNDLLGLLEAKCEELGWSKSGLAMILKKTLTEPQFTIAENGVVNLQLGDAAFNPPPNSQCKNSYAAAT